MRIIPRKNYFILLTIIFITGFISILLMLYLKNINSSTKNSFNSIKINEIKQNFKENEVLK